MHYKNVKNGYLLRIEKGEELLKVLTDFVVEKNLQSGFVQAIGAVSSLELGFYHLDNKEYTWNKYEEYLEISSLTGNISYLDNEIVIHLHGVFANENNNCFGGHVKEATISATCEVFITEFDEKISRFFNDDIGLKLLDLEN